MSLRVFISFDVSLESFSPPSIFVAGRSFEEKKKKERKKRKKKKKKKKKRKEMRGLLLLLLAFCCSHGHGGAARPTSNTELFALVRKGAVGQLRTRLDEMPPESINVQERGSGQSLLMAACLAGKASVVEYLLEAGADATIPEKDGYTPMHGAGFQGRAGVAKLLIQHGLKVDDFHRDGFTPLWRSAWGVEESVVVKGVS